MPRARSCNASSSPLANDAASCLTASSLPAAYKTISPDTKRNTNPQLDPNNDTDASLHDTANRTERIPDDVGPVSAQGLATAIPARRYSCDVDVAGGPDRRRAGLVPCDVRHRARRVWRVRLRDIAA